MRHSDARLRPSLALPPLRGGSPLLAALVALGILACAAGSSAAQVPATSFRTDPDRPIGWLGITIQELSEDMADQLAGRFGVAAGTGVLVVDTMPGGPAASAGLQRGDVIVALDGQPIWDVHQLQQRVRNAPVGNPVSVAVLRDRDRKQVRVPVGPMPDEALAMVLGESLGFVVRPTAQEGGSRGPGRRPAAEAAEKAQQQLVVAAVDPRSPARTAGLRPMDVVVEVDGHPVMGLKDMYLALRAAARKSAFPVAVTRDGDRVVLTLAPGSVPPSP